MIQGSTEKISKTILKLDEFRKNHADMEDELKRRLTNMRKKNIRLFLKQINTL